MLNTPSVPSVSKVGVIAVASSVEASLSYTDIASVRVEMSTGTLLESLYVIDKDSAEYSSAAMLYRAADIRN